MKVAIFWAVVLYCLHQQSIQPLIMEAAGTSKASLNVYKTTCRKNPDDSHLRTCHRGKLKSDFLGCYTVYSDRNITKITKPSLPPSFHESALF
jgi:hypothetical protein